MSKSVKLGIGILLSLAGLYYAFRNMDLGEFWQYLTQVDVWLVVIAGLIMVLAVVVRAHRWQYILRPMESVSVRSLFAATMIGYFGNNVLPFRLGEVLRGYAVSKMSKMSSSSALGTIILERILDLGGLLVVIFFFAMFYPLTGWMDWLVYAMFLGIGGLFAVAIVLSRTSHNWVEKIRASRLTQNRLGRRLVDWGVNILNGLTIIRQTRHSLMITLETLILWVFYYFSMYLVVIAVNVELSWIEVGVILIATTLSISIPAAPGYIGTYHAVAVYVMTTLFETPTAEAQAFAVLVHAMTVIPFILIGATYFARHSIHLSDIKSGETETT